MASHDSDTAGVITLPPLIYLFFLAVGLLADTFWPVALLPETVQYPLGGVLIVLGIAAVVASRRQFGRAETSIHTTQPTTAIVTDGLYGRTRNPIYLGLALIYAGIAIAADSIWALVLLVPTLIVVRYGVIGREERYLEAKFGEPYRAYMASVRRWF